MEGQLPLPEGNEQETGTVVGVADSITSAITVTKSVTNMITDSVLLMTLLGFGFVKGALSIFRKAKKTVIK